MAPALSPGICPPERQPPGWPDRRLTETADLARIRVERIRCRRASMPGDDGHECPSYEV